MGSAKGGSYMSGHVVVREVLIRVGSAKGGSHTSGFCAKGGSYMSGFC